MRLRIPDWLIYLVIVFLIFAKANRNSDQIDAPPPPPELGPILPSESPHDESVLIQIDPAASGVGTAFSINDRGQWLTARHVVDSCDNVGLNLGTGRTLRVDTQVSANTDLAVLSAQWRRKPLASDLFTPRTIGEYGYFFGFPQGRPGEVVGELLGRNRLLVRGRYRTEEGILAWTERGRTRGLFGSLGGLSGGPVLDSDGEVIGVVAAENPRRGRVYSVSPRSIRAVLNQDSTGPRQKIAVQTYGLQADKLRRDRRIAQVICIVD